MKRSIKAFIYPEDGGYVVECPDVHAVTQGNTLTLTHNFWSFCGPGTEERMSLFARTSGDGVLNRRFTDDGDSARSGLEPATVRRHQVRRRPTFKRVVKMAAAMATAPDQSLPGQHEDWADLKAAYRFFNNPKVTPQRIQEAHRGHVRAACASHARILAIQDGSELDYTTHRSVTGLGFVGGDTGRGLLQHSTLAVTTDGRLLGVLHQIWWKRVRTAEGETRRQRQARETESDLWATSIRAVGTLGDSTRVIHVCDRGADDFGTLQAAYDEGAGFLIRAKHDRYVNDGSDRLWSLLSCRPIGGYREIEVPARPAQGKTPAQPARRAKPALRWTKVELCPPRNDPRYRTPLSVFAIYVSEVDPPPGVEAVEWMLLTSETVETVEDANAMVTWYTHRWTIEKWHKATKTGCRLEAAQLKSAEGLERLAALLAVVAVRLVQLRDLAQADLSDRAGSPTHSWTSTPSMTSPSDSSLSVSPPDDSPAALQAELPWEWILVVSHLAHCRPEELTPRVFWLTLAKRGGFLARKSDGLPGWQTIWKGWNKVMPLVQGLELHRDLLREKSCG